MKKILVADDDPSILEAIQLMLEFYGYSVATTMDGKVIEKMAIFKPDLILLDIWMSGVDGRDICKKLKADSILCKTPVIMISASKDVRVSSKESGADDFLAKPFEMDDLIMSIEKHTRASS